MIQLNLLPDVKLEYLKAQRIRRLAIAVSIIVSAAAVAILVLLLGVEAYQKHTLNDLNNDVATKTNQLQKEPHINDVLTVQNQLQSINGLHANEPAATRLFDYLNELVPNTVTISSLTIAFTTPYTISLSGGASSVSDINQFVDTLKFTKYSTGYHSASKPTFSDVVLSSFSVNNQQQSGSGSPTNYSITASFDPMIFNATQNVSLIIPSIVSTRSSLENPGSLFVQGASTQSGNGSKGSSQ